MKTIVAMFQDQNWEDDGGDHDAFVTMLTDAELEELEKTDVVSTESALYKAINDRQFEPTYPLTIHGVYSIWTTWS